LVTPATVRVTAVLAAMVHPVGRVIVTTLAAPAATGVVQVPPVPDVKVTVGVAGTVKLVLKVAVTVFVAARAPVAEVVKPTVQVEVACATTEPGVKVTAVTGAADADP
jgi:hypothetical protein